MLTVTAKACVRRDKRQTNIELCSLGVTFCHERPYRPEMEGIDVR